MTAPKRADNGGRGRKKMCRFCADPAMKIDYKDQKLMENFVTERSKIVPGRLSGACASHQRKLSQAVKRARQIALLAYASSA